MITREQKRMALETARLDYDDGDQWGWAMGHFFAVADTLHHMDANIPYRWHYGHGAACRGALETLAEERANGVAPEDSGAPWPDTEYLRFMDAGELGAAVLTYAGSVLDRYCGRLVRAGKDY